tara:strand:+ start:179 stop:385 length:207 start_codon:yes stop_codon:yes gene_type:complete
MTLTKLQEDIMTVTYAQAQVDLIKMIKKAKHTDLKTLMKVLTGWQKMEQVKIDKLDQDYEEPMELDTD